MNSMQGLREIMQLSNKIPVPSMMSSPRNPIFKAFNFALSLSEDSLLLYFSLV